jgi:hypothetical protein
VDSTTVYSLDWLSIICLVVALFPELSTCAPDNTTIAAIKLSPAYKMVTAFEDQYMVSSGGTAGPGAPATGPALNVAAWHATILTRVEP